MQNPTQEEIDKALDVWIRGSAASIDVTTLPAHIQERLPLADQHARAAAQHATRADISKVNSLIGAARSASTAGKRVVWLIKAAQALSDAYAPAAACRAGCSHCCFIPVKITQAEAQHIGRQIGRAPVASTDLGDPPRIEGYDSPCPFLADDKCSIYEHRPGVCRSHLNLDRDDLLCQLTPGQNLPVPYLDTRPLIAASFSILGPHQPIADLRQWFPITNQPENSP